ncbi:MAG: hypothetical protein IPO37_02770 [Saprospiraceae bacterium]|nr:hypothetical protein [Saprospiraceae bacterium]
MKPENQYRCWDDMKKFGFWSAGGGKRYVDGTKKLEEGDTIYAYISGKGYVGKGTVRGKAKIVDEFFKENNIVTSQLISKLFKEHIEDKNFEDFHNEDIGEYAVKVEWVLKR